MDFTGWQVSNQMIIAITQNAASKNFQTQGCIRESYLISVC